MLRTGTRPLERSTTRLLALPSGRLLVPSLRSDLTEAPFLGETALLFVFTRPMSLPGKASVLSTPKLVYIVLAMTLSLGLLLLFLGLRLLLRARKRDAR